MPELPDVETCVSRLAPPALTQRLSDAESGRLYVATQETLRDRPRTLEALEALKQVSSR